MIKNLFSKLVDFLTNQLTDKQIKITSLVLVAVTVLAGGGYWVITTWFQPLGPSLSLSTPTVDVLSQGTLTPGSTAVPGETLTPTIEPVCGAPPTMTILVTGVASQNYIYGLADAIRLVRFDFQTQTVSVLALPRDLWVEIPGIEDHGITVGKLNQAYFYGTQGMGYYEGSGYGSGLLAFTLQENYGIWTDHYLAVNLESFVQIIDRIGGIDVYLAGDVYRKVNGEPKLFLKAGYRHLNGKKAEILARQRIEIGDFGRINNQTVILKGIAAKMLTPSGLKAIPDLVNQLKKNVLTDLSPDQISQLICLAGKIDYKQDVFFETLPEALMNQTMVYDPVRNINTSALVGDTAGIRSLIEDFQAGIWP
ncbi:MAG: hypothetical protein GQ562_02935 [Anaerolineales bacterium]|nr:hypothetical protein [Anaerolineales bacterium]